jgi:hypothetical protein
MKDMTISEIVASDFRAASIFNALQIIKIFMNSSQ